MNRLVAGSIAVIAGLVAMIRYGVHSTPAGPSLNATDPVSSIDWVMVASLIASVVSAIEALFNGVSKLYALLARTRKPDASTESAKPSE